jgi:hypothetical protein
MDEKEQLYRIFNVKVSKIRHLEDVVRHYTKKDLDETDCNNGKWKYLH